MCTAITFSAENCYFGRNLDYEYTFGEKVTITPRNYAFSFRNGKEISSHYAIIGMALNCHDYPLYFDATNEMGLSMAGLNFTDNAKYMEPRDDKDNIASFEFIPWILTQCKTVSDAEKLMEKINITDQPFSSQMPPSQLHWMIADRVRSVTVEQTENGLSVYDNPVGVLTNNPTFDIQMLNLSNFLSVSAKEPQNRFSDKIKLKAYSRGMGGMGIPGDLSSMSRFVRACFTKLNSVCGDSEAEAVKQFFHILYSVYQQRGCVKIGDGYEITNYTSCCNVDKGIYYYTTYDNSDINAVDMHRENLDGIGIITYDLIKDRKLELQNHKENDL